MRIVHVSYAHVKDYDDPHAWLDGIDFFVVLLEEMARANEVISFHCINYTGILRRNGVNYHFLRMTRLQHLFPVMLTRQVRKLDPHIVIVHGIHQPLQVLMLRKALPANVAIVIQHHAEQPLRHYKAIVQRRLDRHVAGYFFASVDLARPWIKKALISTMKKVHEVMEVPSVFYPIAKEDARAKTNAMERFVYIWVGRIDENKDPYTLLRAFIQFARSNADVTLYLIYHRSDSLGQVERILQDAQDVSGQIRVMENVAHNDLLYWYNSSDFILSTSHYEGMGIAVVEGMSCGCIPILTNIASFRSITGSGQYGILFEAGDHKALLDALTGSLTIDIPGIRKQVLERYATTLSVKAIAEKMIDVCEQIINPR